MKKKDFFITSNPFFCNDSDESSEASFKAKPPKNTRCMPNTIRRCDKLCFAAIRAMPANCSFHGSSILTVRRGRGCWWFEPFDYADVAASLSSFRDFLLMLLWFILWLALSPLTLWGYFFMCLAVHSGRVKVSSKKGVFPDGQQARYYYLDFC